MAFMDQLDEDILAHLQRDGRQTNRELARAVGVAPSTCLERVRALRERGIITGFHAHVSLAGFNRSFQALVAVQARPLSRQVITDFKDWINTLPEVLALFVLTGSDDFLLHLAVRDVEHLHAFLMDKFSKRREIVSFRTSVIYQHLTNPVLEPFGD